MTIHVFGAIIGLLLIGVALGATITYLLCAGSQPLVECKPVIWPSIDS